MEQDNIKSLKKALDILKLYLTSKNEELSLTEIAEASQLTKSTVSRIVTTLTSCGYMRQREKRGKYSLGTIYLEFSGALKKRLKIRNIAIPLLNELNQTLNEAVVLAVWNRSNIALVETFNETTSTKEPLRVVPTEGNNLPLHASSLGKIILASMSNEELEGYFNNSNTIKDYTPNTITDINDMRNHLFIVRKEEVAFDDEEYHIGIRGLAAGLKDGEGKLVGAIGVVAPSVRFTRARLRELVPAVKKCAFDISAELGFKALISENPGKKSETLKT
jgi:IclR family transcriptional regulator, KDG regulon repressor